MPKPSDSLSTLQAKLRDAGLRSTSARIAVLKALQVAKQPLSHNDLAVLLEGDSFDKTTIFRNLTDLTESKLLKRIDVGDHIWRFELIATENDGAGHAHFVCTDCGDVDCLPELELKVSKKRPGSKAKVGNVSEILLKGHCEDCEE